MTSSTGQACMRVKTKHHSRDHDSLLDKRVRDRLVRDDELDRGAALAVVARRAEHDLQGRAVRRRTGRFRWRPTTTTGHTRHHRPPTGHAAGEEENKRRNQTQDSARLSGRDKRRDKRRGARDTPARPRRRGRRRAARCPCSCPRAARRSCGGAARSADKRTTGDSSSLKRGVLETLGALRTSAGLANVTARHRSLFRTLRRCGAGCAAISASAALEPPMKPSMSTSPVFMIGPHVARPEPLTKLIAPAHGRADKSNGQVTVPRSGSRLFRRRR